MTPFTRQRSRGVALGVTLGLLLAGCSGLRSQVSQEFTQARRAQVSYHEGLARYEAQDYRGAIPHFARALTVLGTLYFVGMLARLALGQILNPAPAWFNRPLPTLFHLVLSIWLLLLARRLSEHAR